MRTTTKPTRQQLAVDALITHMPATARLRARVADAPSPLPPAAASAVVASYVGETSADLALVLIDNTFLAEASGSKTRVKPTDVIVPALQESAAVLGTGVLSEATEADAAASFSDPEATIFELLADDEVLGWFIIRLRSQPTTTGSAMSIEGRLGRLNEVEMTLTVEIGRTRMPIRNVLGLEVGAVVELDRAVGAPADILLNGRLIAHGEVVVVDQEFAVRVTRILDNAEVMDR
ncbi:flagellar motor switch protein FliN [Lysinimonas soli]|uniref:Flagellar motor switch protein FliN n=1 Tax=Lysinimonas soli TaxID=1074233 RepID=A0ABW0NRP6_9MICO